MNINYYSYQDLRAAATGPKATQNDINALGEWFRQYGSTYWNGECYDADGLQLYPVYNRDEETDQGDIDHYEFR